MNTDEARSARASSVSGIDAAPSFLERVLSQVHNPVQLP
jgi:hypothetical protein